MVGVAAFVVAALSAGSPADSAAAAARGRVDEPRGTEAMSSTVPAAGSGVESGVESGAESAKVLRGLLRAGAGPRLLRRAGPEEADGADVPAFACSEACPEGPVPLSVPSARATPVPVAIAAPMPNATASEPTRPMYPAAPLDEFIDRHSCG